MSPSRLALNAEPGSIVSISSKISRGASSLVGPVNDDLSDLIHSIKNELAAQIDGSHEALRTEIGVQSKLIGELTREVAALRSILGESNANDS